MSSRLRLVVLASGTGSNLRAVLDAVAAGRLDLSVVGVVVSKEGAGAADHAASFGVPVRVVSRTQARQEGRSRGAWEHDVIDAVASFSPDFVLLAGWMYLLSPAFLDRWPAKILNLHPALPGEMPGLDAIERAWEDWSRGARDHSGCMVHLAVPEVDAGPVLGTQIVQFQQGESREAFEQRFHAAEHALVLRVLAAWVASHAAGGAQQEG